MGLVNKLKNILFEEEEVEIPVIEKKTEIQSYKEMPKKEESNAISSGDYSGFYNDLEPALKEERKLEEKQHEVISERDFKPDKTFNFPDFDEEEFKSVVPKQRSTNVLEYERKKAPQKVEARSVAEKVEEKNVKAKFRPSPIISPVYGILDKNYTPDEITSRPQSESTRLDVDSVRKKAFGLVEDVPKIKEDITEDQILEEKLYKARTIDELLNDSTHDVIEIPKESEEKVEEEYELTEDFSDQVKAQSEKVEEKRDDDTLESDLFDLIDSMYENREEEE